MVTPTYVEVDLPELPFNAYRAPTLQDLPLMSATAPLVKSVRSNSCKSSVQFTAPDIPCLQLPFLQLLVRVPPSSATTSALHFETYITMMAAAQMQENMIYNDRRCCESYLALS